MNNQTQVKQAVGRMFRKSREDQPITKESKKEELTIKEEKESKRNCILFIEEGWSSRHFIQKDS